MFEGAIILTILGWGASGIFAGKASRHANIISLLVWGPLAILPLAAIPLFLGADLSPSYGFMLIAAASALAVFLAWVFYIAALQKSETSPVVAIGSTYPVASLFLLLAWGEPAPGLLTVLGLLFIAVGLFWFQKSGEGSIERRAFVFSLAAAALWGCWGFADYVALQYGSIMDLVLWTMIFSTVYGLCFGLVFYLWKGGKSLRISKQGVGYRIASGLATIVAMFAFYFALSETDEPAVVISVTSIYPVITMLMAVYLKEERIYWRRLVALLLVIVGVIALYI